MKTAFILIAMSLALGGCANGYGGVDERMTQGAVIGGTGGAIVGGVASRSVGGAVVGGVAGAVVGAVVADATRPGYRRTSCYYRNYDGRRICRYR